MCNIAGYIGERRAAPILIEMLRRQEGLNAGFYTGIATLHEGRIHYRKLVGNLDDLLATTDAADLPGNIGIIHSRTPGASEFEGVEYAHPFITERDGEIKAAMVLNGTGGFFKPRKEERLVITKRLLANGVKIPSHCKGTGNLNLDDGTCVHSSDVFCQLADVYVQEGADPASACGRAFCEFPTEAVVLMLTLAKQDAITFARLNFPMHLSYCAHGTYLATTPQAMPEDAGDYHLLPLLSAGYVYKNGFEAHPFPEKPARVAPLTPSRRAKIYDIICTKLAEGEQTVATLAEAIRPAFEGYDCGQVGAAIYQVLDELERDGKLHRAQRYNKGQSEGLKAPEDYMWL